MDTVDETTYSSAAKALKTVKVHPLVHCFSASGSFLKDFTLSGKGEKSSNKVDLWDSVGNNGSRMNCTNQVVLRSIVKFAIV